MKTTAYCAMACVAILFTACNLAAEPKQSFRTHTQITDSFTSGLWGISSFVHDGTELKNKYAVYNFKFSTTNRIIVEDNISRYAGSWSVGGIEGNDDRLPVDVSFRISIKSPPVFSDFNGHWSIAERTPSTLSLRGMNKKTKSIEYLIFEKR